MSKLILATNNFHKIKEIKDILKGSSIEILSAKNFDDFPEIEESGETLEENASIKAKAIWEAYHLPCLADDTGLEVEYLDGAPGVYSARFAGPNCSFDDNNRRLLSLLESVPAENRKAQFRTVMALADTNGRIWSAEGRLNGWIGFEKRGENGFGYDPIFMVAEMDKSLAELSLDEKNKISHRSRALEKIKPIILRVLKG